MSLQLTAAAQPFGEIPHLDYERDRFEPGCCVPFHLPEQFRRVQLGHPDVVADLAQILAHFSVHPLHVVAVDEVVVDIPENRDGIERPFSGLPGRCDSRNGKKQRKKKRKK